MKVTIDYSGNFFTRNPIGPFHRNQYDLIREVGEVAVEAARERAPVSGGSHRVVWKAIGMDTMVRSGSLRDSIAFRPKRASRGARFIGRGIVVQGARGYEPVRVYGARASQKTRHMWRAASVARAWVKGNQDRIGRLLLRNVT
jgi:hypothetical protein